MINRSIQQTQWNHKTQQQTLQTIFNDKIQSLPNKNERRLQEKNDFDVYGGANLRLSSIVIKNGGSPNSYSPILKPYQQKNHKNHFEHKRFSEIHVKNNNTSKFIDPYYQEPIHSRRMKQSLQEIEKKRQSSISWRDKDNQSSFGGMQGQNKSIDQILNSTEYKQKQRAVLYIQPVKYDLSDSDMINSFATSKKTSTQSKNQKTITPLTMDSLDKQIKKQEAYESFIQNKRRFMSPDSLQNLQHQKAIADKELKIISTAIQKPDLINLSIDSSKQKKLQNMKRNFAEEIVIEEQKSLTNQRNSTRIITLNKNTEQLQFEGSPSQDYEQINHQSLNNLQLMNSQQVTTEHRTPQEFHNDQKEEFNNQSLQSSMNGQFSNSVFIFNIQVNHNLKIKNKREPNRFQHFQGLNKTKPRKQNQAKADATKQQQLQIMNTRKMADAYTTQLQFYNDASKDVDQQIKTSNQIVKDTYFHSIDQQNEQISVPSQNLLTEQPIDKQQIQFQTRNQLTIGPYGQQNNQISDINSRNHSQQSKTYIPGSKSFQSLDFNTESSVNSSFQQSIRENNSVLQFPKRLNFQVNNNLQNKFFHKQQVQKQIGIDKVLNGLQRHRKLQKIMRDLVVPPPIIQQSKRNSPEKRKVQNQQQRQENSGSIQYDLINEM
ncbi:UNKNOWN [Stylonychia lemnae]|uniref:Uncharacterized protein n=1 Tax=Stylonychia lemnae TaxID=5949 RepID=A0A078AHT2_STYLE|nr:UNKNOWN [Stylonychia lemnae]|eukprot:CDW81441.1 UNKNOWN [Stylonychia lemnae]